MRYFLSVLVVAMGQSVFAAEKIPTDTQNPKKGKSFTLAVLPDTQFYCDTRLKLSKKWGNGDLRRYFFAQTRWVRDNQKRLNIAFLVHEGDIVQADFPEEWAIAKEAMSVLDGKVPYCMCLGNHDMGFEKADNKYGGNIAVNRTTHFNKYFPREKFAKRREFGGTFHPNLHDNSWYHFEAAGMKFLIVSLECKPRDEVLAWANKVVAKHPEHRVIVLTHAYMRANGRRIDKLGYKIKGNAGEEMWQKLVSKHKNIFMVLCGHSSGEAVLTSKGDHGNQVHQVLSDYQHLNNGGESWLRYMVFKPNENKIKVYTYNPVLDKFRNTPSSRFDLDYPMAQPPVTAPGITLPGAANDVNESAEVLFDGKTLDHFEFAKGAWEIEKDGSAVCRMKEQKDKKGRVRLAGMGYLWTKKEFSDFELSLSYKLSPGANSGVFYRTDKNNPVQGGFELQLMDNEGFQRKANRKLPPRKLNGSFYDGVAPAKDFSRPVGQWNKLVLRCKGPIITCHINGGLCFSVNVENWDTPGKNPDGSDNKFKSALKDLPRKGRIGFQNHGQVVWFKDIRVSPLR